MSAELRVRREGAVRLAVAGTVFIAASRECKKGFITLVIKNVCYKPSTLGIGENFDL